LGLAAEAEDGFVDDVAGLNRVRGVAEAVLGDPVVVVVAVDEGVFAGALGEGVSFGAGELEEGFGLGVVDPSGEVVDEGVVDGGLVGAVGVGVGSEGGHCGGEVF